MLDRHHRSSRLGVAVNLDNVRQSEFRVRDVEDGVVAANGDDRSATGVRVKLWDAAETTGRHDDRQQVVLRDRRRDRAGMVQRNLRSSAKADEDTSESTRRDKLARASSVNNAMPEIELLNID